MAHAKKYQASGLTHMFRHYDRAPEVMRRKNIDPTLTEQNYAVGRLLYKGNVLAARDAINAQHAMKRKTRKDAVLMIDWVITAPLDLRAEDERKFFELAYRFMADRYGEENMLGGRVHKDERGARTHMHAPFMPIVHDAKAGVDKFNAKKVLGRGELKTFHKDMNEAIDKGLGYHVSIILDDDERDKKKLSRLDHDEYVQTTAALKRQQAERDRTRAEVDDAKDELRQTKADVYALGPDGGGIEIWHADGSTEHEPSIKEVRQQRDAEAARMARARDDYGREYDEAKAKLDRINGEINDKSGTLAGLERQIERAREAMPSAAEIAAAKHAEAAAEIAAQKAQEAAKAARARKDEAEAATLAAKRNKASLDRDIARMGPAAARAKAEAGVTTRGLENLWARIAGMVASFVIDLWDHARARARQLWQGWTEQTPETAALAGIAAARAAELNDASLAAVCRHAGRDDVYHELTSPARQRRDEWER